jgi:hypothetical protein
VAPVFEAWMRPFKDLGITTLTMRNTGGTDHLSLQGGQWVLRSGNEVFRLNNQAGLEHFAGQNVEITGTLDSKHNREYCHRGATAAPEMVR